MLYKREVFRSFDCLFAYVGAAFAVPDVVLYRNGPLTDDERELLNEHPHLGGFLVAKAYPDFSEAVEAIWYHHERPDGKGLYSLRDSEIPKLAGIVSLIGAVESMANGRPHRAAISLEDIVAEIQSQVDKQFSRRPVAAFHETTRELYAAVGPGSKASAVTISALCESGSR